MQSPSVTSYMSQPDCIPFGRGTRPLVVIPGLSAIPVNGDIALLEKIFRIFMDEYRIYVIDRPLDVPEDCDNAWLAEATLSSMDALGITAPVDIIGTSQGGMIAQHIAVSHPERVHSLVLAATIGFPNATAEATFKLWISLIKAEDYKSLNTDMFSRFYTDAYLEAHKKVLKSVAPILRPHDTEWFLRLTKACASAGPGEDLRHISCPTLVVGADNDTVLSGEASEEIASRIPNAELIMMQGFRHAFYDESPDFYPLVYNFLKEHS